MTRFDDLLQPDRGQTARAIEAIAPGDHDGWLARQSSRTKAMLAAQGFRGKPGHHATLPGEGEDWRIVAVVEDGPWSLAGLSAALPAGTYRVEGHEGGELGWLLGQYRFDRYRRGEDDGARILLTRDAAAIAETVALAGATAQVRDLVNTPASDCGPADLEAAAEALATRHGGTVTVRRGDELERGYPMIHAVGHAAARNRAPRLIELVWGDTTAPRIALVGKGVSFDTGGLDIKPSSGMRLMKKDMGGAAHALALAELVMAARLPVRLHLLIPAVENAISGDAFRPGDVLRSRKGLTVENTNTDAEGRLILADALTRAGEEKPELILDFATLTGAARVALGPDLPPLFSDDEALARDLLTAGERTYDPLWRLPLWNGYDELLKSDIADMVNAPEGGFAGAITAALFLRRFVPAGIPWAHLDVFAWRPGARPGRPKGGDAYGLRAAFAVLKQRYSG